VANPGFMVYFRFWALLFVFVAILPQSAYSQTPKKFILGLASIGGGIDTLYVMKKIGAFKRNGLRA
jgi:hypothetical protein